MIIIKSQDGEEILKCHHISRSCNEIYEANGFELRLGSYATLERAQEVLDEIWLLMKQFPIERMYEMPKE